MGFYLKEKQLEIKIMKAYGCVIFYKMNISFNIKSLVDRKFKAFKTILPNIFVNFSSMNIDHCIFFIFKIITKPINNKNIAEEKPIL